MKRIDWIDYEKGFILLGVCIEHINLAWNIFPFLETFHMAAFFFLSGLLYKPERFESFEQLFHSKCKSLFRPYIILSFFFLLLTPKLYHLETHLPGNEWQNNIASLFTSQEYIHSLLVQIQIYSLDIINGYSAPFVAPLWFVFTLFQLNILWYYPIRVIEKTRYKHVLFILISLICFILGWLFYMRHITIPFKLHVLTTSSAFFIVGYLLKLMPSKLALSSINKKWILSLVLLTIIFVYGATQLHRSKILYVTNDLDPNFPAYSAVAFGGTMLLTSLFLLLSRIESRFFIHKTLKFISSNGIAILAIHNYILFVMRWEADVFKIQLLANPWVIIVSIVIICIVIMPIINRYFYKWVGKKKPITQ